MPEETKEEVPAKEVICAEIQAALSQGQEADIASCHRYLQAAGLDRLENHEALQRVSPYAAAVASCCRYLHAVKLLTQENYASVIAHAASAADLAACCRHLYAAGLLTQENYTALLHRGFFSCFSSYLGYLQPVKLLTQLNYDFLTKSFREAIAFLDVDVFGHDFPPFRSQMVYRTRVKRVISCLDYMQAAGLLITQENYAFLAELLVENKKDFSGHFVQILAYLHAAELLITQENYRFLIENPSSWTEITLGCHDLDKAGLLTQENYAFLVSIKNSRAILALIYLCSAGLDSPENRAALLANVENAVETASALVRAYALAEMKKKGIVNADDILARFYTDQILVYIQLLAADLRADEDMGSLAEWTFDGKEAALAFAHLRAVDARLFTQDMYAYILSGESELSEESERCLPLGRALARLHTAGLDTYENYFLLLMHIRYTELIALDMVLGAHAPHRMHASPSERAEMLVEHLDTLSQSQGAWRVSCDTSRYFITCGAAYPVSTWHDRIMHLYARYLNGNDESIQALITYHVYLDKMEAALEGMPEGTLMQAEFDAIIGHVRAHIAGEARRVAEGRAAFLSGSHARLAPATVAPIASFFRGSLAAPENLLPEIFAFLPPAPQLPL